MSIAISWSPLRAALPIFAALPFVLGSACTTRCASDLQDACHDDEPPSTGEPARTVAPPASIDIRSTNLAIDVTTHRGVATVELATPMSSEVVLEVGNLVVESVRDEQGPLTSRRDGDRLVVTPRPSAPVRALTVEYRYRLHRDAAGATTLDSTLTWPDHCGNLFPCVSDPSDGATFRLHLTGIPDGLVAVYPERLPVESPAYAVAWALGRYRYVELGRTTAGTTLGLWAEEEDLPRGRLGTADLVAAFDWLERTLGPYPYGARAGSVAVDWPDGALGGMEHHPFWHIERAALEHAGLHVHEAVHGWFGNGVRLRCWEDFVLSEGTASYLAARALEAARGEASAREIWARYGQRLARARSDLPHAVAWPAGCGRVDVDRELFNSVTYMAGAFFLRALERRVGRGALDAALREFVRRHLGRAAGFGDLLAVVREQTGYDASACADLWLRSTTIPATDRCP